MRVSFRTFAAAGLAGALAVLGLAPLVHANASFTLTRVAGTDRYATASAIAGNAFTGTATNVVIARGDDFADALAGAYLAGVVGGPVLLTSTASVPQSTKDRLTALGAKNVYLLGGTSAISQAVQDDLGKTYTVTRIQGVDRFETASKVAQQTNTAGVGTVSGAKTAIIASGEGFADALAAGSASFAAKFPIVLTNKASLPSFSSGALTALGIKHALVVGGTAVINSTVVDQLTQLGITSERIAGNDRYETSTKIADWEATNLTGWSSSQVDVANGDAFADALGGGPASGRGTRPLVLVQTAALPGTVATWLQAHAATLQGGRVFGGTGAVSAATVTAFETAAGGGVAPRTGQVTSVDKTNHRYTFVPTGATTPMTASYKKSDTFSSDGSSVQLAAFESALTVADTITYTPSNGTTAASHVLANVNSATITSGTVGNVVSSSSAKTFDFINPVTGDALRSGIDFSAGSGWSIDGASGKTADQFGADLNEGDTLTITGTAFALTNKTVTGIVNTITKGTAPLTQTTLKIDNFGDDPTAGDTPPLVTGNDSVYKTASGDVFSGEATDFAAFTSALNDGDRVSYSRAGGKQTFNLVNLAPTVYTGQGTGTVSSTPTGGSFTLATSTKAFSVSYQSSATFVVNGGSSTKAAFEAAYSPGDLISYNGADTATGTAERVELVDQPIAGPIPQTGINTGTAPPNNKTYQVLATNGFTVLTTVTYNTSTAADNVYVLNGASTDLAGFEAVLSKIASGDLAGSVMVTKAGSVTTHALTTSA
jgi:putative cell wall-binding protein